MVTVSLGALAIVLAALSELDRSRGVRVPFLTRGGQVVEDTIARRTVLAGLVLTVALVALLLG